MLSKSRLHHSNKQNFMCYAKICLYILIFHAYCTHIYFLNIFIMNEFILCHILYFKWKFNILWNRNAIIFLSLFEVRFGMMTSVNALLNAKSRYVHLLELSERSSWSVGRARVRTKVRLIRLLEYTQWTVMKQLGTASGEIGINGTATANRRIHC